MTREEIYGLCLERIGKTNSLMMELATGTGKTKLAIMLINHLCGTVYQGKDTKMLLLVAKTVHKQTWKDEFEKWGGIQVNNVVIECYESLKKHKDEAFDFVVLDEVHHIQSDIRMDLLETLHYGYMIGLSATIPRGLKRYLQYRYHSAIVSCDITEAIEDNILPEPQIILFPLQLDNLRETETIIINPKATGIVLEGRYRDIWKFKKQRNKAIVHCTPKQKLDDFNSLIQWEKNRYMQTRSKALENSWLFHCNKRLEFLAQCKNPIVNAILFKLSHYRTITFCKTIEQAEILGKNCIHSKNALATQIYDDFNQKKINHITAVNILNENANLVECKYAIFANISSSEIVIPQRLGRAMRHKSPVIIVPYYKNTREEEVVKKMFEGYNKDFIKIINSVTEL